MTEFSAVPCLLASGRARRKMRTVSCALCLWIFSAILMAVFATPASADQLLRNSGFAAPAENGIAHGWKDNSGWADVSVHYNLQRGGLHGDAQHIRCRAVRRGTVQFVQAGVRLQKGRVYRVSIWARGSLAGPLGISLRKQGYPYTTYAGKSFRLTAHWRQYTFVAAPAESDSGAYFMVTLPARGNVWLADASLKQAAASGLAARPRLGNLISNGSFEVGLDRWAVKVRDADGYQYSMPINAEDIRPSIITGHVPVGARAMHIAIPAHGRAIITTPPFKLAQGYPYTVSLWLKANVAREVNVAVESIGHGSRITLGRGFKVNAAWKHRAFRFKAPAGGGGSYVLLVQTRGVGGVSLDGVQVAEGDNARFQPAAVAEIGFTRSGRSPIFYRNQPISLRWCVATYKPISHPLTVTIRSRDFFGNDITLLKKKIAPAAAGRYCATVAPPSGTTGYFRLTADLYLDAKRLDRTVMGIAVVPRPASTPSADSPFGGHARFSRANLEAVRQLGVAWLRMHPPLGTKWFVVEPSKGRFKFDDKPILAARAEGFHLLGSLAGTPRWASSAPSNLTSQLANGFRAYPPVHMSDWATYVSRIVAHYKGVINAWEVWNEPNSSGFLKPSGGLWGPGRAGTYVRLVESAYRAAKKANPHAVIVAGVGSGKPPSRWVSQLVERGILPSMDVLSFHYYTDGRPGDALGVPISRRVAALRSLMLARSGHSLPIWETESGLGQRVCGYNATGNGGYCVTPRASVAFVVRNYADLLASGVSKWFFYHMFFPDRTDRTTLAGFFDWDRSPMPLAVGYAVMAHILQGTTFVKVIHPSKGIAGVEFSGGGRLVRLVWVSDWTDKSVHSVSLQPLPNAGGARVYDAMGRREAVFDAGKAIRFALRRVPKYVVEPIERK